MNKQAIKDFFWGLVLVNSVVTTILLLIGVSGVNSELNWLINGVKTTTDNKLMYNLAQFKQYILSKEYIAFMLCIQVVYFLGFVNFYESIKNARPTEKE